jgi:hypothetical protein
VAKPSCGSLGPPRATPGAVNPTDGAKGPHVGWIQGKLNAFLRILDEERWLLEQGEPSPTALCRQEAEYAYELRDALPAQLAVSCSYDEQTDGAVTVFMTCMRALDSGAFDRELERALRRIPDDPPKPCQ